MGDRDNGLKRMRSSHPGDIRNFPARDVGAFTASPASLQNPFSPPWLSPIRRRFPNALSICNTLPLSDPGNFASGPACGSRPLASSALSFHISATMQYQSPGSAIAIYCRDANPVTPNGSAVPGGWWTGLQARIGGNLPRRDIPCRCQG